ncbi:molybdopterin-dependent oxidoreductase [Cupriavidus metallidurans]|uniref:2Fe-2S iron-sulfur cluster binding domain-containing protein n=1 Tax=Cupriavidus metallidurans TaxID=119219 RepID=A0A482IX17_9BURK|nr:molybdopterin-dependent oxidoreductase [Cupriavidus metallidurans]QBP12516.1 2Fe-2S iron-sulfur cluster binding domain-containing protein [Cupriavidus metallidurans]
MDNSLARAEVPGYCTLCRSRCGTLNEIVDDRLVSVRPDPMHPTGTANCAKGRAAPELIDSPYRVLWPMRRTTPKGSPDPGWQRITWDEAMSEVANRLGVIRNESGPEAVAFGLTTPSGTPISDSIDWIERFIRGFGSPNTIYGTEICNWHKDVAHTFTFGTALPVADYSNADTMLLWGHNPTNTWLAQATAIGKGRERGAKLVVVDPRRTPLAAQADAWLPVRPGTDTALALGMIRAMIERRLYDHDFVLNWTNAAFLVDPRNRQFLSAEEIWPGTPGYVAYNRETGRPLPIAQDAGGVSGDWEIHNRVSVRLASGDEILCHPAFALLRMTVEPFTPDEVTRITGVPSESMLRAVELLKGGRRIAYHSWTGVAQHTNATQSDRAIASLYALSGSFDRIGGNRIRRGPALNLISGAGWLTPERISKALGITERPIGPPSSGWILARDFAHAVTEGKPYRVRALMAFGGNMLISHSDTELSQRALETLEFHVHCDLFETPSARFADIFLPVNTPWEHEALRVGFEINDAAAALIQFRPRMVSARGESKADYEIVIDLAQRLGMGDRFFDGDRNVGWNHMLSPLGVTVNELRKHPRGMSFDIDAREQKYRLPADGADPRSPPRGFLTETGRVELYSGLLARHGQPPVATYLPPQEFDATNPTEAKRKGQAEPFPLILSSAKSGYYCHSQHRALASLRKRAPDPVAEISSALAAARGISDGDWIRISSRAGEARFRARLEPQMADDLVIAEFGWWQASPEYDRPEAPARGRESTNFNSLIAADATDPVSGSLPLRSFRCQVSRDPFAEALNRGWKGFKKFRLDTIADETEHVRHLSFRPADGLPLPDYHPGQHVQVRLGGEATMTRAYSLTGAAEVADRHSLSIAVRHQFWIMPDGKHAEGRVSSAIHRLAVGDLVELSSPSGGWVVPRFGRRPLILVAGGVGITPFLSLMESMPDGDDLEMWLFYSNTSAKSHAFRDRIRTHVARLPGLSVLDYYTAPEPDCVLGRDYHHKGRITPDCISAELIARRPSVYMCAAEGLISTMASGLIRRGVPKFDIFSEAFRSPPEPMLDNGRTFNVRFARSGDKEEVWRPSDGPLLDFATKKLGISLPSGCRVGQCESCAIRIISGHVRHLGIPEPEETESCLTCQAVPVTDITLDA